MNSRRFFLLLLTGLLVSLTAWAADVSGSYAATGGAQVELVLKQKPDGSISGKLIESGSSLAITGKATATGFSGTLLSEDGDVPVQAKLNGTRLVFQLADDEPLAFERQTGASQRAARPRSTAVTTGASPPSARQPEAVAQAPAGASAVVVNGRAMNQQQVLAFQQLYGVAPRPGRYWYDGRSGLYGYEGQPAAGFLRPGHDLGALPRQASQGNSGVVINGRELPQQEWMVWSSTLGYAIQPGHYWLDGNGNAGYEGNPFPVVNLYQAAQQRNAYYGNQGQGGGGGSGGGGGDNFWSTRFSAGNHDSSSGAGYVSVPGYGPVGYGMD